MMTMRALAGVVGGSLLLVLFATTPCLATTHHVGSGESIGDALAAAATGDSVVVACGTYQESGLLLPDGVVLRSETGDPACVTITTTGGEPILTCTSAGGQTRIEGITLTVADSGWAAPVARGAGLRCEGSSPYVHHCRFVDLSADYGGAVYCGAGSSPVFYRCEFSGNDARAAGGALNCVGGSSPLVIYCLFTANSPAVNAAGDSRPHLVSCTLAENFGGLVAWDGAAVDVEASIIATSGSPWSGDPSSVPTFTCTDIWGHQEDWAGLIAPQATLAGNLAENPVFCGAGAADTPWGLDSTSPCAPGAGPGCGLIGAFDVVCSGTTGISDRPPDSAPVLPEATRLRGNHPNPFNPRTEITFALRRPGPVVVSVYDLAGRLVKQLLAETLPAGDHALTWTGEDRQGRQVAAGVYVVHLRADGIVDAQRMTLVR